MISHSDFRVIYFSNQHYFPLIIQIVYILAAVNYFHILSMLFLILNFPPPSHTHLCLQISCFFKAKLKFSFLPHNHGKSLLFPQNILVALYHSSCHNTFSFLQYPIYFCVSLINRTIPGTHRCTEQIGTSHGSYYSSIHKSVNIL